jgi:hypothetical protein
MNSHDKRLLQMSLGTLARLLARPDIGPGELHEAAKDVALRLVPLLEPEDEVISMPPKERYEMDLEIESVEKAGPRAVWPEIE